MEIISEGLGTGEVFGYSQRLVSGLDNGKMELVTQLARDGKSFKFKEAHIGGIGQEFHSESGFPTGRETEEKNHIP